MLSEGDRWRAFLRCYYGKKTPLTLPDVDTRALLLDLIGNPEEIDLSRMCLDEDLLHQHIERGATRINVAYNSIETIRHLCAFTGLRSLSVRHNPLVKLSVRGARLTHLDLSHTNLRKAELKRVAEESRTLNFLRIAYCGIRSARTLGAFLRNNPLVALDAAGNRIKDVSGLLQVWVNNTHLYMLDLSGNPLGDQGVAYVATGIALSSVQVIYLVGVDCGDSGVRHLARAARARKKLQCLALELNPIKDMGPLEKCRIKVLGKDWTFIRGKSTR